MLKLSLSPLEAGSGHYEVFSSAGNVSVAHSFESLPRKIRRGFGSRACANLVWTARLLNSFAFCFILGVDLRSSGNGLNWWTESILIRVEWFGESAWGLLESTRKNGIRFFERTKWNSNFGRNWSKSIFEKVIEIDWKEIDRNIRILKEMEFESKEIDRMKNTFVIFFRIGCSDSLNSILGSIRRVQPFDFVLTSAQISQSMRRSLFKKNRFFLNFEWFLKEIT